jgi:hypothetical protein
MSVRSAEAIVQATPRQRSETVAQNLLHRLAEGLKRSGTTHRLVLGSGGAQFRRSAENQAVERDIDGTVSTPARSRNTFNAATTASDGVARSCAGSGQRSAPRRGDI